MQTLLFRIIEQGEKARQVNGILVQLLQENLAESYAGRVNHNPLTLDGRTNNITIEAARRYAYNIAREILRRSNPPD